MAKKSHPFLPMFVGDFMAATAEWEGEEQALYGLLLMHQWALGHLPVEVPKLARLVRYDQHNFERWWPTVSMKFELREVEEYGDRLFNPRLEQHRAKSLALSEKNSEAGKRGAAKKWRKDGERHQQPMASATRKDGERHKSANGARHSNPSHPIPSHPDPSEVLPPSPQDSGVSTTTSRPGPTHANGNSEANGSPDPGQIWQACKAAYPRGLWEGPKEILAERAIGSLLEQGIGAEQLVSAAAKYCDQQTALGKLGTEFVRGPEKFYGDGYWRGPFPLPAAAVGKSEAWRDEFMRRTDSKTGTDQ